MGVVVVVVVVVQAEVVVMVAIVAVWGGAWVPVSDRRPGGPHL